MFISKIEGFEIVISEGIAKVFDEDKVILMSNKNNYKYTFKIEYFDKHIKHFLLRIFRNNYSFLFLQ